MNYMQKGVYELKGENGLEKEISKLKKERDLGIKGRKGFKNGVGKGVQ